MGREIYTRGKTAQNHNKNAFINMKYDACAAAAGGLSKRESIKCA